MMRISELLLTFTETPIDFIWIQKDLKIQDKIQGILQDSRRFNKDSQIPKIQPRFKDFKRFESLAKLDLDCGGPLA